MRTAALPGRRCGKKPHQSGVFCPCNKVLKGAAHRYLSLPNGAEMASPLSRSSRTFHAHRTCGHKRSRCPIAAVHRQGHCQIGRVGVRCRWSAGAINTNALPSRSTHGVGNQPRRVAQQSPSDRPRPAGRTSGRGPRINLPAPIGCRSRQRIAATITVIAARDQLVQRAAQC